MTTTINGSSPSITFSDGSAQTSATRPFQNRLINGAMVIDQRNAGAAVTTDNTYCLDRFLFRETTDGTASVQQSSTAPAGFVNSLLFTVTSADSSLSTNQYAAIQQRIEGFNTADLGWGSASAKTVCLSFWVRSSVTGTFGGSLSNSAGDRSYPFSYTISSANTFEYKTITITGDTSGTWLTTNGIGIQLNLTMGAASNLLGTANAWSSSFLIGVTGDTNLHATNGATLYITGVQLEVGSTATSFDYRPYTTELGLCYRYCYALYKGDNIYYANGLYYSSTNVRTQIQFPVNMRTTPTITYTGYSSFYRDNTLDANNVNGWTVNAGNSNTVQLSSSNSMSGTAGQSGLLYAAGGSQLIFLAEL